MLWTNLNGFYLRDALFICVNGALQSCNVSRVICARFSCWKRYRDIIALGRVQYARISRYVSHDSSSRINSVFFAYLTLFGVNSALNSSLRISRPMCVSLNRYANMQYTLCKRCMDSPIARARFLLHCCVKRVFVSYRFFSFNVRTHLTINSFGEVWVYVRNKKRKQNWNALCFKHIIHIIYTYNRSDSKLS